jgi:hypothetical protein
LLEPVLRDILKSVLSEIRILMNFTVLFHFSKKRIKNVERTR